MTIRTRLIISNKKRKDKQGGKKKAQPPLGEGCEEFIQKQFGIPVY
jgi:hypothetical protein